MQLVTYGILWKMKLMRRMNANRGKPVVQNCFEVYFSSSLFHGTHCSLILAFLVRNICWFHGLRRRFS